MKPLPFLTVVLALAPACATTSKLPPAGGPAPTAVRGEPVVLAEHRVAYPAEARRRGVGGTVKLMVWLDERGTVERVEVVEGPGFGMDEAAAEALRRFRFRPAHDEAGKPIPFRLVYRYTFFFD